MAFIETTYEVFEINSANFGSDEKQIILKPTHQSFDTMGKANLWILQNGVPDVNYTIIEILRKRDDSAV